MFPVRGRRRDKCSFFFTPWNKYVVQMVGPQQGSRSPFCPPRDFFFPRGACFSPSWQRLWRRVTAGLQLEICLQSEGNDVLETPGFSSSPLPTPRRFWCLIRKESLGEMTAFTFLFLWHIFAFLNVLFSLDVVVEQSTWPSKFQLKASLACRILLGLPS